MKQILIFIFLFIFSEYSKSQTIELTTDSIQYFASNLSLDEKDISIIKVDYSEKEWKFDLDSLKYFYKDSSGLNWDSRSFSIRKKGTQTFHVMDDEIHLALVREFGSIKLVEFVVIEGVLFGKIYKTKIKSIYY